VRGHHLKGLQGYSQGFVVLLLYLLDVGQIVQTGHQEKRVGESTLEVSLTLLEDLFGLIDAVEPGMR
jgi:hypothetical protein